VILGGGAQRSHERAAAKGADRFNSLAWKASLLLNSCGGSANKAEKSLAVTVGLPIGRPFGKGNGRGTGRLLDAAVFDRFPCVKLVLKQKRAKPLIEAFCNYEPQLVGMLPQNHRRSRFAEQGLALPCRPLGRCWRIAKGRFNKGKTAKGRR